MKRPLAEPDQQGPLTKRLCHDHNDEAIATHDAVSVDSHRRSRLDLLPTEILLMILELSLEPALIHTSRRMYTSLPSYVPFSKALALTALSPRHPKEHSAHGERLFKELPKVRDTEQDHIRKVVFASAWFQERHLRHIHHQLLHGVILQACAHSKDGPSRGQRKRIKSFIAKETSFSTLEQLNLR